MTEKRYFKREWEEEYYIFDSTNITEEKVDRESEYGYDVFADSMQGDEVVDKLNEQYIEIQRVYSTLDNRIEKLQEDLEKLKDMDNTEDLNPQAVEDVALVISMYISALKEFKKELIGDVE